MSKNTVKKRKEELFYRLLGAYVYDRDHVFRKHDVYIKDGFFIDAPEDTSCFKIIELPDFKLIPGLTDIHFHGCMGHDFCEGNLEVIKLMAMYEEANGITNICPATMTLPEEKLLNIVKAARSYKNETGANLSGINMEGPFISEKKAGAQNPGFIKNPDLKMFDRIMEASGGLIKLVDIAPELPGTSDFILRNKDRTIVSFAHSDADYDTAKEAFEKGMHHITHIYNAMNPINHRAPGPIIAAIDNGNVEAEIICDGIHVHPSVVKSTLKLFGSDKVIFISDSMEAAGMPDGDYELGGLPVRKEGNRAFLSDGTIAGSAVNLMDCLRTAVLKMGIPLETAVKCAAVNPARSIGIYDRTGSIEAGKSADLVALNDDLEIKMVINRGKIVNGA